MTASVDTFRDMPWVCRCCAAEVAYYLRLSACCALGRYCHPDQLARAKERRTSGHLA